MWQVVRDTAWPATLGQPCHPPSCVSPSQMTNCVASMTRLRDPPGQIHSMALWHRSSIREDHRLRCSRIRSPLRRNVPRFVSQPLARRLPPWVASPYTRCCPLRRCSSRRTSRWPRLHHLLRHRRHHSTRSRICSSTRSSLPRHRPPRRTRCPSPTRHRLGPSSSSTFSSLLRPSARTKRRRSFSASRQSAYATCR